MCGLIRRIFVFYLVKQNISRLIDRSFLVVVLSTMLLQVLITKLRSANSVETQQYRKGSKALLVLIPLLGLTYVLVIAGPTEGLIAIYFSHIRAVLLSTQVSAICNYFNLFTAPPNCSPPPCTAKLCRCITFADVSRSALVGSKCRCYR